ncbi:MAG: chloride channel protein [Clostridia bacterium]|nr:chloride channel protein [Clostridia bacterium]
MHTNRSTYIKNILLPCLLFSVITGIFTGTLIFLFKAAASFVIGKSEELYAVVRSQPGYIPLFILGMTLVGLISAVLLRCVPDARGGGIPTAIAILRGLIPFCWVKTIVFVFASSMLTYFGGVPLGNEGPSVQMGTAVGRGTVSLFTRKNQAWDRYIMTGGACAGFAAATGSPITGIMFAVEEAHRRISPMIFMAAAVSTLAGTAALQFLCGLTDMSYSLFHFTVDAALPLSFLWSAIAVGLVSGFTAAGFTKAYRLIRHFVKKTLARVPFILKIVLIFTLSACVGVVSAACIGSGHHLIESLLDDGNVTLLLLLILLVRALLLLLANNADVTGGLFVPQLAFGAIVGALCGKAFVMMGLLPEEYYPVMVVIGIASYLSASSRTPLIALAFSLEALDGLSNLLPIAAAVTVSFLVIETLGMTAFTDIVIESKTEAHNHGKEPCIVDTELTVAPGSFVCGKEARDLLLPPTCMILSIHKNAAFHVPSAGITEGDVLRVHYRTYDPEETMRQLEALVGPQPDRHDANISRDSENDEIPEL